MLGITISLSVLVLFDRLRAMDLRRSMQILLAAALYRDSGGSRRRPNIGCFGNIRYRWYGQTASQSYLIYTQPTQTTKLHNYLFDTFGPYPIAVAAVDRWH